MKQTQIGKRFIASEIEKGSMILSQCFGLQIKFNLLTDSWTLVYCDTKLLPLCHIYTVIIEELDVNIEQKTAKRVVAKLIIEILSVLVGTIEIICDLFNTKFWFFTI